MGTKLFARQIGVIKLSVDRLMQKKTEAEESGQAQLAVEIERAIRRQNVRLLHLQKMAVEALRSNPRLLRA